MIKINLYSDYKTRQTTLFDKMLSFSTLMLALLILVMLSEVALALPNRPITQVEYSQYLIESGNCQAGAEDLFAPGIIMKKGEHKGQCMDTSAKRALVVLAEDASGITFANFRHKEKFWTAQLSWDALKSASYIVVDLKGDVAFGTLLIPHAEIRFKLTEGKALKLVSQDGKNETAEVNDFIFSFNFMAPKGIDYDPIAGLDEDLYGSVFQLFSMDDERQTRFVAKKQNVYEVNLRANKVQLKAILHHAIWSSHIQQYAIAYHTLKASCTNKLFDIIDEALFKNGYPKDVKKFEFSILDAADTAFEPGLEALQKRKLIDFVTVKVVNWEFGLDLFKNKNIGYFLRKN
jgi:hypothetical protein